MKKLVLLVFFLGVSMSVLAQKKGKTIVTIDGEKTSVSEFKRIYEKNLDAIDNEEAKSIEKNLELFINYKLKVKEAYSIKLDTLSSYKKEIDTYRDQLSQPYLRDTTYIKQLVKDAYYRTKNELKVKHILVTLAKNSTPKDTLKAYAKIVDLRKRIINGEDFGALAVQFSDDPSAKGNPRAGRKGNQGNLGYFSAFRMVYPFEQAAYATNVGEISMPFRTQFGYHILQIDKRRISKGQVEVAHVLIADTSAIGKNKIDGVFSKLEKKENFEALVKEYSDDSGSKENGGKLNRFGTGVMVQPFNDAAFSLTELQSFSKPFKTRFGWHILKLLNKYPIPAFEEMEEQLTQKIKSGDRMKLSVNAVVQRLKSEYKITENEVSKKILDRKDVRSIPKDSLNAIILSINDKNITQENFVDHIKNNRNKPVYTLFEEFKDKEILTYYKENLKYTEPAYANTIKEYEDGLLLFELMQQKIWKKSSTDTIGLQNYFDKNINVYKSKTLDSIQGKVMNDYQNFLEKNWISDLRKKSKIKVNKKEVKRLISFYEER